MMTKTRIEGRRNGNTYEVVRDGAVISSVPLTEAQSDSKLAAAIKRNGWEQLDAGQ